MTGVAADNPLIDGARAEDRKAVLALLGEAGLTTAGIPDHMANFFVARSPEVVGTVGLEYYGAYALLRSLAVTPSYRGRGVGRRLVARAVEAAAGRGVEGVFLLTTTARDFFARLGFRVIGREEVPPPVRRSLEFCALCPASAAVMGKLISPHRGANP